MDNKFNQTSNFFKKEGFYVILFVCLCIVATIAVVASRNNKQTKNQPLNEPNQSSVSKGIDEQNEKLQLSMEKIDEKNKTIEDAAAVQGKKPEKPTIEVHKTGISSVATSTVKYFSAPLKGKFTFAKEFTNGVDEAVKSTLPNGNTLYVQNFGIEIKPGSDVTIYAIADGTVEDVSFNDNRGEKIIIKHSNGLKTVYANLSEDVLVKKNDKVKVGTAIGKIGGTDCRPGYGEYKDCLHFEVIENDKYVNPVPKYVKAQ